MFQVLGLLCDEGKIHVQFLKKSGKMFLFGEKADESCPLLEEVQKVLPEPRFDRRGHFFFDT